jgi:hypothetical protein
VCNGQQSWLLTRTKRDDGDTPLGLGLQQVDYRVRGRLARDLEVGVVTALNERLLSFGKIELGVGFRDVGQAVAAVLGLAG